ncbi:MAG TPA: beta-glucosidase [Clostridiales bacterium]|nr:beta-glucosidase [Clostridiales bacterium]
MNRLEKLLKKMTLREKLAQMVQVLPFVFTDDVDRNSLTGPLKELNVKQEDLYNIGTVYPALNVFDSEFILNLKKQYFEKNPHGIPLLVANDVVHGLRTIFPIPLAISCTWDPKMAELSVRVAAVESYAVGIHVTYAPMADLVRDPRWGRVLESSGEDVRLACEMTAGYVRGFQGDDVSRPGYIASCVKHFAGYGAVEGGRDYNNVDMSERRMREYYLPAYKAAVDAGCKMVMTSFNTVDGIPSTANKWLIQKILREEWDFKGVLISDWSAVTELINHTLAKDRKHAAELAVDAGIDIEMVSTSFLDHLEESISQGHVDMQTIDKAVMRILQLEEDLGLFENPFRGHEQNPDEVLLCQAHRDAAREVARKSAVLLKNEDVLPFSDKNTIALIGPYGDDGDIIGAWHADGRPEESITIYAALKKRLGENLKYAKCCEVLGDEVDLQLAGETAAGSDYVVLAIGESPEHSGECASKTDISLSPQQIRLAEYLKEKAHKIIAVVFCGRPLDLTRLSQICDAILLVWFPGTQGGEAITELLLGDYSPSGKLSTSFPRSVGQIPVHYDHFTTGRPLTGDEYDLYS